MSSVPKDVSTPLPIGNWQQHDAGKGRPDQFLRSPIFRAFSLAIWVTPTVANPDSFLMPSASDLALSTYLLS